MTSTKEDPNRLVGTVLGSRFEIKALAALDEAGARYEATDTELSNMASVRVLHRIRPDDASLRRLLELLTEVSSLEVDGIKRLRAVGRTRTKDVYYATDAVVGQALVERLEVGPLMPEDAATCLADAGEILAQAHRRGVVHGALHPGAVVLPPKNSNGSVQLLDFGLGPLTISLNVQGGSGTSAVTAYQSPEQAKAEPFDHRADIYALGALLYEALTGQAPFAGQSAFEVLALQLRGEAPSLARGDARFQDSPLQQVIDHCMQVSPADRYETMQALVMALRRAGQAEATRKVRLSGPRPAPAPAPERGAPRPQVSKPLVKAATTKAKAKAKAKAKSQSAKSKKAKKGKKGKAGPPSLGMSRVTILGGILVILLLVVGFVLFLVYAPTEDDPSAHEERVSNRSNRPTPEPEEQPADSKSRNRANEPRREAGDGMKIALVSQNEGLNPKAVKLILEGNSALAQGKFPQAVKRFRAARRIAPQSPDVARGLGMAYLNQGKRSAASKELRRYLDLDPNASDKRRIEATLRGLED